MLWHINDELLRVLFADAPTEPAAWRGIPFGVGADVEVVPIQFLSTRYLVFFTSIVQEFGGDVAFAQQMAATWSGGFIPAGEVLFPNIFEKSVDLCRGGPRTDTGNRW